MRGLFVCFVVVVGFVLNVTCNKASQLLKRERVIAGETQQQVNTLGLLGQSLSIRIEFLQTSVELH